MPGPVGRRGAPLPEKVDLKKNIGRLLKDFKPYYLPTIISFVFVAINVVLAILAPQVLKQLTDTIMAGAGTKSIDLDRVAELAIRLVVFYGTEAILGFFFGFIMNTITQKYSKDLRTQISEKLNRMTLRYFDSRHYGDTLSVITNDVDQIGQSLQQSVTSMAQSIFMLIGVLIAMFATSWQMALTVLASIPLVIITTIIVMKFAMPMFRRRQKELGEVNGIVEEIYSGQIVVKSFNAEESKGSIFDEANEKLHQTMFKAQFFGGIMQPMMNFVSYVAYAAVCLVGGLLLAKGNPQVTFGTISAFMIYVNLFQRPLSDIAQSMNVLQMAAASASRVFELLDAEEQSDESGKNALLDYDNIKGRVEFKNVKFGYDESRIIIPNFSATVEPGMKVAIVGPTGAGKTTMVNLLMRFYEVNEGDILIDGVSIKDMSRNELRDIFGMVLQDTWIFEGTLKENIVYNKTNVDDERLNEIIDEANLTHYVSTLSKGLDTELKEDSSLSAGQKQLVTIARAMVENAPLLILDEATSNVDTRTEIQIQEAMDKLTKGRTSFVIAHRLSTIKNADMILVMKDGNIIEQGNHDELIAANGFYAGLYNSQFSKNGQ